MEERKGAFRAGEVNWLCPQPQTLASARSRAWTPARGRPSHGPPGISLLQANLFAAKEAPAAHPGTPCLSGLGASVLRMWVGVLLGAETEGTLSIRCAPCAGPCGVSLGCWLSCPSRSLCSPGCLDRQIPGESCS